MRWRRTRTSAENEYYFSRALFLAFSNYFDPTFLTYEGMRGGGGRGAGIVGGSIRWGEAAGSGGDEWGECGAPGGMA